MAFYNKKMAHNKLITKAWRAAHSRKINCDDDISLPEICDEIGNWMRRDRRPRNRLSLRSFSVLLSGAIRIYRDQVDLLLKDTFICSIQHPTSSTRMPTPEQYSEDNTPTNEVPSESTEYNTDTESLPDDGLYETESDDSTLFTETNNSCEQSNTDEQPEKTRDQIIQTSPTPETLDPNLPFGYIIVHDNYHSRIPSKILFSSLSENMKFLPHGPMNSEYCVCPMDE